MTPAETRLERVIREKLEKAISKKAEDLIQGVPTFDRYREEVGYIRGLKDALTMLEKARAESFLDR